MPGTDRAGILLVDKPSGPTSHDVVEWAREALEERRIGHTGTLDPFATGLLILCVGRATRLAEYFHLLAKRYRAVLRLGVETTTHDPEGDAVDDDEDRSWQDLSRREVEEAVASFRGTILQRPPAFSAKRVDGRRAHRAARAGEAVELEAGEVRVHELTVVGMELPRVTLSARVSTGTYVRSLARDIGRELGCGAHLEALRRTGVGPFTVEDAVGAEALSAAGPRPGSPAWRRPAEAVTFLARRQLSDEERRRVGHGGRIARGEVEVAAGSDAPTAGPVALVHEGELVAVAEEAGEELQPRKVLRAAD